MGINDLGAISIARAESEFEDWWESDGQYCRAGGGSYEKTFAFRAWEAATARANTLLGVPQGCPGHGRAECVMCCWPVKEASL